MRQALPYSGFEWSQETFSKEKILKLDDDSDTVYIFKVTLTYPQHLHDEHSQFPLAPHHVKVEDKDLSSWQKELKNMYGIRSSTEKLCLSLKDCEKYILHYRNLKLYI